MRNLLFESQSSELSFLSDRIMNCTVNCTAHLNILIWNLRYINVYYYYYYY